MTDEHEHEHAMKVWEEAFAAWDDTPADPNAMHSGDQAAAAVIAADRAGLVAEIERLAQAWEAQHKEKVKERDEARLWFEMAQKWAEPSIWPGLDHIANYINSLDTEGMSGLEVRKAIYRQCIQPGKPTRGDPVARVVEWLQSGAMDPHNPIMRRIGENLAAAIERGEPFNAAPDT